MTDRPHRWHKDFLHGKRSLNQAANTKIFSNAKINDDQNEKDHTNKYIFSVINNFFPIDTLRKMIINKQFYFITLLMSMLGSF